jgi:hypothetical protein
MFASSIALSVFPLWLSKNGYYSLNVERLPYKSSKYILPALFVALSGWVVFLINKVIAQTPIAPTSSDIIPQISVMVRRFIYSQEVYAPIINFGYTLFPTYLPFKWLPFTLAELCNCDFRWLAFVLLLLALALYYMFLLWQHNTLIENLIKGTIPFVLIALITKNASETIGMTVETLDLAYYLILIFALLSDSNVMKGTGLALCLLSRYSLVLWVPLFVFVMLKKRQHRDVMIVIFVTLILIAAVYVIPFLARDPGSFKRGFDYYTVAALAEWAGQAWQPPGDKPLQLFQGYGFACYFYELAQGELLAKIYLLKKTQLVLCTLSLVVAAIVFCKLKNLVNERLFLLLSLKFYLTFFYSFIVIPYQYLFIIPVFISLYIVSFFSWEKLLHLSGEQWH